VIVDGTWALFLNVRTKEQSNQWMRTYSPNKPRKFKQTLSACKKANGNCFLGQERVLVVEFMQQGITITSEMYCETLKKPKSIVPLRIQIVECWHPVNE
jgi:hypothetical protein